MMFTRGIISAVFIAAQGKLEFVHLLRGRKNGQLIK